MSKKNKGFIFLMTLLFTAVISLLIVTLMQHVLLYHKVINKQKLMHQNFYQLEKTSLQLANPINPDCVRQGDSINETMHDLMRQKGCVLTKSSTTYRYFIENLGEFPCLVVQQKGQNFASAHLRISIMRIEEEQPTALLQIRIITAGTKAVCTVKRHQIPSGVTSWRYFSSLELLS